MPRCKRQGCCCGPCYKKSTCEVGGFLACRCVPKKVCLFLWTTEEGCACVTESEYEPADATQLTFNCDLGGWSGALACNGTAIDIEIGFHRDATGEPLEIYLQSNCLGYVGDYRLFLPWGGEYDDAETRRTNCENMGIEFDIDLSDSDCIAGCGAARITLELDDLACREFDRPETNAYDCEDYTVACIEYETYGGTIYREKNVCLESGSWDATLNDVEISIAPSSEPHELTLTISEGEPYQATLTPECPFMFAEWEMDDGSRVRIWGDQRAGCTDCLCVCENLCVSRYPSGNEGTASRNLLSWSPIYQQWSGGWTIAPVCDPCTGITSFELTDEAGTITFSNDGECPDLSVAGLGRTIDEIEYVYYIECKKCQDCVLPSTVEDECDASCPDVGLPITLTATVENPNADCLCADGLTATLNYNFHPTDPAWIGSFQSGCLDGVGSGRVAIRLECDSSDCVDEMEPCRNLKLSINCGGPPFQCPESGCSCDPLDLLFGGFGGGCTNCDEPATSQFDIRITE